MTGSSIPQFVRRRVRRQAGNRCGYCLSPQWLVFGPLEIEHIVPKARGSTDDEENLWLACRLCNNFKGSQTDGVDPETGIRTSFFNPRQQKWSEHFRWSENGTRILGVTPCGRATVV